MSGTTAALERALSEVLDRGGSVGWWRERFRERVLRPKLGERLPWQRCVYHGIPIKRPRFSSNIPRVAPWQQEEYVAAIERAVRRQDEIAIVGAGWGVSTGVAAWATGPGVRVRVYEAAEQYAHRNIELAHEMNLADRIEVNHALVGDGVSVWGEANRARVIDPAGFDPGDVLVMDCEGAEPMILEGLDRWPREVVVETHVNHGAPAEDTLAILREQYETIEREPIRGRTDYILHARGEA